MGVEHGVQPADGEPLPVVPPLVELDVPEVDEVPVDDELQPPARGRPQVVLDEPREHLLDPRGEMDLLPAQPRLEVRSQVEIADQQEVVHGDPAF